MTTMTAGLYQGDRKVQITQFPRPEVGPKDAVVRVRSEGICGSDLQYWWDKAEPETIPAGHEVAGEIVEVGAGVDPARVGERVAIDTLGHGLACTECWYCRMGQPVQCQRPAENEGGGYAQFIKRRAAGCFALPDGIGWEQAALVEPLAVSVHAVRRLKLGNSVVFFLYPHEDLAKDMNTAADDSVDFSSQGFALAHNARSKEEVHLIFSRLKDNGATIVKVPEEVFWGGYSGYFSDPDGHSWEVAYNPHWTIQKDGRVSMTKD